MGEAIGFLRGDLVDEAEQALLDIGIEYSNALASYAAATPQGQPNYPKSFAELLKDPKTGLPSKLRSRASAGWRWS